MPIGEIGVVLQGSAGGRRIHYDRGPT